MGKLTISMAIFNSYVKLPEGTQVSTSLYNSASFANNKPYHAISTIWILDVGDVASPS